MRIAVLAAMAVAVLAGGCAETDFTRANTSQEEFKRDESACRRQVNAQLSRDRSIDSDIATTLGAQQQQVRPNDVQTRQQMASRGDTVRTDRLMESCMRARGYSGTGESLQKPPADKKP